jgi:hypothetical protein
MSTDADQFEDDVAEMVLHLAHEETLGQGVTDAAKQQFRDALTKFIDARIAETIRLAALHR